MARVVSKEVRVEFDMSELIVRSNVEEQIQLAVYLQTHQLDMLPIA
nr:hypothetical protein [Clostridioides sp.]